jgi:hypothetical protein
MNSNAIIAEMMEEALSFNLVMIATSAIHAIKISLINQNVTDVFNKLIPMLKFILQEIIENNK